MSTRSDIAAAVGAALPEAAVYAAPTGPMLENIVAVVGVPEWRPGEALNGESAETWPVAIAVGRNQANDESTFAQLDGLWDSISRGLQDQLDRAGGWRQATVTQIVYVDQIILPSGARPGWIADITIDR